MVSKIQGLPYRQYNGNALRILKTIPATVDEVVIGVKNKPGRVNKLTTFRDSKGNILERCYDNFGKPFRNLLYTRRDNVIGEDEYVVSTVVNEYQMPRKKASGYTSKYHSCEDIDVRIKMFWKKLSCKIDHFSVNVNTDEKILSQSKIEYNKDFNRQIHSFTEFVHLLNGKKQGEEKTLGFAVENKGHNVIKSSFIASKGVKIPDEDTYLPYRAVDLSAAKLLLAKRAIKDRGLGNANITVIPNYNPKEDEKCTQAVFSNWHGDLCFNKFIPYKSKSRIANTAYHEAEHGWHYFLDARLSEGGSPWQDIIYFQFGPITSKKLRREAQYYKTSIDNYVPYNGKNYKRYMQNYIEIKAHQAGKIGAEKYDKEGNTIREDFPHIPAELL